MFSQWTGHIARWQMAEGVEDSQVAAEYRKTTNQVGSPPT